MDRRGSHPDDPQSATGFLFPFTKLLPSHIVAIISLVLLAVAVYALSARASQGSGAWSTS